MEKKALVLITSNFPYGTAESYLETEIHYLEKRFDPIIIFSNDTTSSNCRDVPLTVTAIRLSPSLNFIEKILSLKYLFSWEFYREIKFINTRYEQRVTSLIVKTLLITLQTGDKTAKFIKRKLLDIGLEKSNLVFYSYWNSDMAYGISKLSRSFPNSKAITRAHRWDIYHDEHIANYLPLRKTICDQLDAIYFISDHGRRYFESITGITSDKLRVSRLGISNSYKPVFRAQQVPFTIVSCSAMIKRKRLALLVEALSACKDLEISWTHIGDGPEDVHVQKLAAELLDEMPNIQYNFLGFLSNTKIYKYYAEEPVNLFISISESEGIPVAIMEAISFGIPVIATDVGGMAEITNNENGTLLPANPTASEVAGAIEKFCRMDDDQFQLVQRNAYRTWNETFNSASNYSLFTEQLIKL